MPKSLNRIAALLVTFLVASSGCGDAGLSGTNVVTGVVTYKGTPVDGASVTFSPTGEGRAASGFTGTDGTFTLTSLNPGDGALAGTYDVIIAKIETSGGMSVEEAEAYLQQHNQPPPAPKSKDLLPTKYKNPAQSGLTATVSDGGENHFTFALED